MESEIVGVTGILVTCSYANQEFFRVGYYVNNYYEELELAENPPEKPLIDRLIRHILVEKPRVTKFQIQWDDQAQSSGLMGDAMNQGGMMMMSAQEQQQMEEGCLQPGTQFKDRNDMMSSANLQAAADYFGGGAPQ
jgi:histone chaperone ASF1